MSAVAVGFCLSAVWLIPFLILHFRSLGRIEDLLDDQRAMNRAWADALAASRPRPAPSIRRPEADVNEAKMSELRRLAERPPSLDETVDLRRVIIPVDF